MKKFFIYGLGCVGSLFLCGLIALIIAPSISSPTVYTDSYVESIAPDIYELDGKLPRIAQLIIEPQFDDSWDTEVEQSLYAMQKMQDKLERIQPPLNWQSAHDGLMASAGYCVTSTDILRAGADAIGTSESFMDLCISGIERFKAKIEPFIE